MASVWRRLSVKVLVFSITFPNSFQSFVSSPLYAENLSLQKLMMGHHMKVDYVTGRSASVEFGPFTRPEMETQHRIIKRATKHRSEPTVTEMKTFEEVMPWGIGTL